jgi:hypothetical protein
MVLATENFKRGRGVLIGCDVLRREDRDAGFTVRKMRSALIIFHLLALAEC